jgi:hypothetical protein
MLSYQLFLTGILENHYHVMQQGLLCRDIFGLIFLFQADLLKLMFMG